MGIEEVWTGRDHAPAIGNEDEEIMKMKRWG
jgi:hypothetical protein